MSMFCYQCEQTSRGVACTEVSVCGKDPESAALQDLLVHAAKGISQYAHRAAELGTRDREVDVFVLEALFATVTNVDFDPARLQQHLRDAQRIQDRARKLYEEACQAAGQSPVRLNGPTSWRSGGDLADLVRQGRAVSITSRQAVLGEDVTGLQELVLYGLKGAAAYLDHAVVLGADSPELFAVIHEALDFLCKPNPDGGRTAGMGTQGG